MSDTFSVHFFKRIQLAQNTWQFLFEKPSNFVFTAGQYTTVFLGKDNRDFTICADPSDRKYFSIVTKRGISDFKKKLFALKPGSSIMCKKPAGGFVLQDSDLSPHIFLAGGIGMTVFYSIILDACTKDIQRDMTLFVSFSKKEDMCFYAELKALEKKFSNLHITYTLSQDKGDEEGRISEALIKKYIPDFQKQDFMIAGGEQMVYDTEELLLKMKVPQEKIRIDIFTGY